jgi:hypothetical protein
MNTYYELLDLHPKAARAEIYAVFRRVAASYRPTISVEQVVMDDRFREYLNGYLTLYGAQRDAYDAALRQAKAQADAKTPLTPPRPFDALPITDRHLLLARLALWRRETMEAVHQLRLMLEREPTSAVGWSVLGETLFIIGHLDDGIKAYEYAVKYAPEDETYADRLEHARDVQAGKAELDLERSPEEELLRKAQLIRWKEIAWISTLGLVALVYAFICPIHATAIGFLDIPWRNVVLQAVGVMLVMAALAYGRVLSPFERTMIRTTTSHLSFHGRVSEVPNGLLLFVMSMISLWFGVAGMIVFAQMMEEWSLSTLVLFGGCALCNIALTLFLALGLHLPWQATLIGGGNILALAGMLGWWVGSFNTPEFY